MKIKLVTCALAVLLGYASMVSASISVGMQWDSLASEYVYLNDGVTPIPAGSTLQLIWSADTTLAPLDLGAPLTPAGSDVLLTTVAIPDDGATGGAGWWLLDPVTYSQSGGYVFTRVFATPYGSTPAGGSWYDDGQVSVGLSDPTAIPTPPPDSSTLFTSDGGGAGFSLSQQIPVPEPATYALFGIGLAAVMLRRKFVK